MKWFLLQKIIAKNWNEDPAKIHHEYATARDEFRAALRQVVLFHLPSAASAQVETTCREILGLLK